MKFNKLFCHNNAWGGAYWGARKGPSALLFLSKGPLGLVRLVMPPPPGHAAATPKALVSPCASQESPTPPMPQMLASTSTDSFLATSSWKEYLKTNLRNKCFAVFLVPSSSGCLSIATGTNSWGWPFLLLKSSFPGASRTPNIYNSGPTGSALRGPGLCVFVCILGGDTDPCTFNSQN